MNAVDSATTVSFKASHIGEAITKVMSLAKVTNTAHFYTIQILEIIGKKTYVPVFSKLESDKKGKVKLPHERVKTTQPDVETSHTVVFNERSCASRYIIEVA